MNASRRLVRTVTPRRIGFLPSCPLVTRGRSRALTRKRRARAVTVGSRRSTRERQHCAWAAIKPITTAVRSRGIRTSLRLARTATRLRPGRPQPAALIRRTPSRSKTARTPRTATTASLATTLTSAHRWMARTRTVSAATTASTRGPKWTRSIAKRAATRRARRPQTFAWTVTRTVATPGTKPPRTS